MTSAQLPAYMLFLSLSHAPLASDFDVIALIQCTSPCLKANYLQQAHLKMLDGFDSVFSAYHDDKLRWQLRGGQLQAVNFNPFARPRRQDLAGKLLSKQHAAFS